MDKGLLTEASARLPEAEGRLPLLGKRRHALALVGRAEQRHEKRPLVPHALDKRGFERAIDRLLCQGDRDR